RGKDEKADRFQGVVQSRETSFQRAQTPARSSQDSRRTQHCVFLSHRFARYLRAQGYQIHRPAERMARRISCCAALTDSHECGFLYGKPHEVCAAIKPGRKSGDRPMKQHENVSFTQPHRPQQRPPSRYGDSAGCARWRPRGGRQGCSRWHFHDRPRQIARRCWPRSPVPCCAG
ncbi:MAG: hypothetical protein QOH35_2501, partial [Acidobacteriaceae bacterium]|nr:hypothetical protein [Acidobacteriaceae bacterium]